MFAQKLLLFLELRVCFKISDRLFVLILFWLVSLSLSHVLHFVVYELIDPVHAAPAKNVWLFSFARALQRMAAQGIAPSDQQQPQPACCPVSPQMHNLLFVE